MKKSILIPGIAVFISLNTFSQLTSDTVNYYVKNTFLQLKDINIFGRNEWVLGDVYSDDSEAGGEPGGHDQPDCQKISGYEVNECNTFIQWYWKANYKSINYCNTGLKTIDEMADPDDFQQQKAHFNFVRGLCYFNLVKVFGDVPLLIDPFNPDTITEPRTSSDEVWQHIESDLIAASSFLPVSNAGDEKHHPTKGAADAMLAKAYIYQEKWDSAWQTAALIINSGQYALEENFQTIFKLEGESGVESIFEIEQGDNPPTNEFPNSTNVHNMYQNPRQVIVDGQSAFYSGWGFNCPTQNFTDGFEEGDPRLSYSIAREGDSLPYAINDNDTTWALIDVNYASPTGMYSRKYEVHSFEHDVNIFHPLNIKVIRFADVLLWAAEAAYNLGFQHDALLYVNEIRARARNSGNTGVPADLASVTIQDIIHERRVELGMEGHRFFDLQRYHHAGYIDIEAVIQASGKPGAENFTGDINILLPIPVNSIAISNGILAQNPGYGSNASYMKNEDIINAIVNTGNSQIMLTEHYGCLSGGIPVFSLRRYTDTTISSVSLSADQLDITHKQDTIGIDKVYLTVGCGCSTINGILTIAVREYTGINVQKENEDCYSLFPNPIDDMLNIRGLTRITIISIYTLTGEKIKEVAVNQDVQMDMSNLRNGIYLLKLFNDKGIYVKKIIK